MKSCVIRTNDMGIVTGAWHALEGRDGPHKPHPHHDAILSHLGGGVTTSKTNYRPCSTLPLTKKWVGRTTMPAHLRLFRLL